jgi:hypothetical protein
MIERVEGCGHAMWFYYPDLDTYFCVSCGLKESAAAFNEREKRWRETTRTALAVVNRPVTIPTRKPARTTASSDIRLPKRRYGRT